MQDLSALKNEGTPVVTGEAPVAPTLRVVTDGPEATPTLDTDSPSGMLEVVAHRITSLEVEVVKLKEQLEAERARTTAAQQAADEAIRQKSVAEKLAEQVIVRQTAHRARIAELERQNKIDKLTGVLNFRGLGDEYARHVERQRRRTDITLPDAIAFVDVDNFKAINTKVTHDGGNQVLVALTEILKGRLREGDILARYGGDEFVVILPHTGKEEAKAVAEELRKLVSEHDFSASLSEPVTVSIGVSTINDPSHTIEDIVHQGSKAMLKAKQEGKDRVVIAEIV